MPYHTSLAHFVRAVALLAAAAALTLPSWAHAAQEPSDLGASSSATPSAAADRVIVVWEEGVDRPERVEVRDGADASLVRTLGDGRFQLLRTEPGRSVADAIATLRDDPAVRTAARETYDVLHATTNDPLFGQLWGLQNLGLGIDGFVGALGDADIDVQRAWNRTRGSSSIVIADLDSGYRFDHPDLGPVAWSNPRDPPGGGDNDGNGIVDDSRGADFVGVSANTPTRDGDPTDDNLLDGGHGVHTAGTMGAAGNDGIGITGVAQDVRIMPLRVCSYFTDPSPVPVDDSGTICPASSQIEAINYAGAHTARVANMSLGGTVFNRAVQDAIASNPTVLFVISAGNDAEDNDAIPHYPCAYDPSRSGIGGAIDNIVCVAATDQADELASFSDWGATSVDLGAPGTETLSAYPALEARIEDDFEVDDFAASWTTTRGTGFGRAGAGDGPLTSFGMNDSPGGAPASSSAHETTSVGATIPAGSGSCMLSGRRRIARGSGGSFFYSVLRDDVAVFTNTTAANTSGSGMSSFSTVPIRDLAGHVVKLRFGFTAGSSPSAADGLWLDELRLECYAPLSTQPTYHFLDGTSMAAPHVTGAAGLLFSLDPGATVLEVKGALLDSVDPLDSLDGITVTGGGLNAADALEALVPGGPPLPPETEITSAPTSGTTSTTATFAFRRTDELDLPLFECQLDGGAFQPCASGASFLVGVGPHTFAVRAVDEFGTVDPTPASVGWTVVAPPVVTPPVARAASTRCVVPRLRGLSLSRARRALARAHCRLGRVRRPRARRGRRLPPLVVRSSRPGAGSVLAENARVAVTLKVKPPRRARRRARRR